MVCCIDFVELSLSTNPRSSLVVGRDEGCCVNVKRPKIMQHINSVTRYWNKKVAHFSDVAPKNKHASFYLKTFQCFQDTPKVTKHLGSFLKDNLSRRTFQNHPIWSHWAHTWHYSIHVWLLGRSSCSYHSSKEVQYFGLLTIPTSL